MTVSKVAAVCLSVLTLAAPVVAQDEVALKTYFEGRRVTLRIDMPGSADGVDVRIGGDRSLDYKRYQNDLKRYGVAIESGDSSIVTLVKVKKDLIEFQIGGGGFGTFGDDTSTSSNIQLIEKSDREKDIEKRVRDEKDRDRRRALERDLDNLRDRRERENRRLTAERERVEAMKRDRIAAQRLRGGSRFNLRYQDRVPVSLRPEDVMAALAEYADFRQKDARRPADLSQVRKGMLREDAERAFGPAVERSEKKEGGVVVTTLVFDVGEQRLTASFVEDVLIRYTISSK